MSAVCDARQFRASDLHAFELQPAQRTEGVLLKAHEPEVAVSLAQCAYAITICREEIPVGCMGLLPVWRGRAIAWAMIAQDIGVSGLKHLCRIAQNGLREAQLGAAYRRVETTVRSDFDNGIQLAMMLGFAIDGEMPCYDPDGNSYLMMSRLGLERY